MTKEPLDTETYIKVVQCLAYARREGRDPVEVLHVGGLLSSPASRHATEMEVWRDLHRRIASWRPAEFLRMKFPAGRQCTPSDMYSCILEYIERVIAGAEELHAKKDWTGPFPMSWTRCSRSTGRFAMECDNFRECGGMLLEQGSPVRTKEVARVKGWHIFEGLDQGGREHRGVLCPRCVGTRRRLEPAPPTLDGQEELF
jgi:hypothetical protein